MVAVSAPTTAGTPTNMANSEDIKEKAAERGETLDEKYDEAVARVGDKLSEPADKLTDLGRKLTGMEEDSST
jgi:hypothetical protein